MLKPGKISQEKLYSFYLKTTKEAKEKGYTKDEIRELLLKFISLEELDKCEKMSFSLVEDNLQKKLEDLEKLTKKLRILSAVSDYNDYLIKTDFDNKMTKSKYDKINNIYNSMKDLGMEDLDILKELKIYLTDEDISAIISYAEIEDNIEVYEEYKELLNRINLSKNKGHRARRFARGKRL